MCQDPVSSSLSSMHLIQITSRLIDHRITDPVHFLFRDRNRSVNSMHLVQVGDIHRPLLALTVDASLQGGSISGCACHRDVLEHSIILLYLFLHTEHLRFEGRYCTCS